MIIERALTKRIMEHANTDIENEKDFERRIKLMEELEAQQWADREKVCTFHYCLPYLVKERLLHPKFINFKNRNWTNCARGKLS